MTMQAEQKRGVLGERSYHLTAEQEAALVAQLRELYEEQGYTSFELATALHVAQPVVGALLRRYGVQIRVGAAGKVETLVASGRRASLKLPRPRLPKLPRDGRSKRGPTAAGRAARSTAAADR